jgi:hypothetical protein
MATRRRKPLSGLGALSKQHYVAVADLLCKHRASSDLIRAFADYFGVDNSRFDGLRFVDHIEACKRRTS